MRSHGWLLALFGLGCSGQIVGSQDRRRYSAVDTSSFQKGRVTTAGTSDARSVREYDGLGRSVATEYDREGTPFVFRATYGYPQGSSPGPGTVVLQQEFPDHEVVQFGYDAKGEQVSITAAGQPVVASIKRNARGQTIEVTYGDGTVTTRQYNDSTDLRLSALRTLQGGSDLQSYGYLFDLSGNVISVRDWRDGSLSADYGYDSLDRLTSMSSPAGSFAYAYDGAGNLLNKESPVQNLWYGEGAGPHAVTKAGTTTFAYDANGNATSSSDGMTITYGPENMPVRTALGGITIEKRFVGEEMWKKIDSSGVTYLLPSVRAEAGGAKLRKYYGAFAERDPDDGDLKFYHGDHLGSAVLVTKAGQPVYQAAYYPYGESTDGKQRLELAASSYKPKYRFTGKEKESVACLYDYGARVYNPCVGRFLSADTSIEDGLNRYAYVRNNPLVYVDPTGRQAASYGVVSYSPGIRIDGLGWFVESTKLYLDRLKEIPVGAKLLSEIDALAKSKGVYTTIKFGVENGENELASSNHAGVARRVQEVDGRMVVLEAGPPSSSVIELYALVSLQLKGANGAKNLAMGAASLGHELIHHLHSARGEDLVNYPFAGDVYAQRNYVALSAAFQKARWTISGFLTYLTGGLDSPDAPNHEEARTTGIGPYQYDEFTDNQIRTGTKILPPRTSHISTEPLAPVPPLPAGLR
jgi:RHS repeat-associated protein